MALAATLWLGSSGPAAAFVEDTPPTFAHGGVDRSRTADPPAVAAAQRALVDFYAFTNREYGPAGYANPQAMREEVGNRASRWLDQTLALARGQMVCGWKCRNWIPNKGWRHEAPPPASQQPSLASAPLTGSQPTLAVRDLQSLLVLPHE